MLLYTMLYIVLAYLMLFAALTNSVCLNNSSFFFLFKYFLCQGYELSGEIALKNNHYYYYLKFPYLLVLRITNELLKCVAATNMPCMLVVYDQVVRLGRRQRPHVGTDLPVL